VLKLAQSDAQAMVDIPGIGPARLSTAANPYPNGDEEGGEKEEKSATEKYVDLLRNRTWL
ncbi:MAG: hypothetical protein M3Q45_12580, partial [Chloroflexota bacterium]|nr:hypothetical protein [Chloroflexota bacterium]